MKSTCIAICLYGVMLPVQAHIYQWTDSNGVAHFGDEPHHGATLIKLKPTQSYHSSPIKLTQKNKAQATNINHIDIVQPIDKATIRNPQGSLTLIVSMRPSLKKEHKLQVLLDGSIVTAPQINTAFRLKGLTRGAHTIIVQQLNKDGQLMMSTKPITIYMMPPKLSKV